LEEKESLIKKCYDSTVSPDLIDEKKNQEYEDNMLHDHDHDQDRLEMAPLGQCLFCFEVVVFCPCLRGYGLSA